MWRYPIAAPPYPFSLFPYYKERHCSNNPTHKVFSTIIYPYIVIENEIIHIQYSLSAIRYSLFAIRYSLSATRYSLIAIRYSLSPILYFIFHNPMCLD